MIDACDAEYNAIKAVFPNCNVLLGKTAITPAAVACVWVCLYNFWIVFNPSVSVYSIAKSY